MARINTHGLKIKELRKASGKTENYGAYSDRYNEIFYDRVTGEVWTIFQVSLGQNWWTEYHDANIIKIGNTQHHMTMQQIADAIRDAVDEASCFGY